MWLPTYMTRLHVLSECALHKLVHLPARPGRELAGVGILLEAKLGPHHYMHNLRVDTVGPVIAQYPYIGCMASAALSQRHSPLLSYSTLVFERFSSCSQVIPPNSMLDDIVHNAPVLGLEHTHMPPVFV